MTPTDPCARHHTAIRNLEVHAFPADKGRLPLNGVYVLFERGELGHGGMRIVRIGSHTGADKLPSRMAEHTTRNKDRSIFRKNIGRALLNKAGDPFLEQWNFDLTSRAKRARYGPLVDDRRQSEVEEQVSRYLLENFTFSVIPIGDKVARLGFEKRAIATVAQCPRCRPSPGWLGNSSPLPAIRDSGLWLKQHLGGEPLNPVDLKWFDEIIEKV